MFGFNRHREDRRYYLLPGMGRSNKRHRRRVHLAAIAFGAVMAGLFGVAVYFLSQ